MPPQPKVPEAFVSGLSVRPSGFFRLRDNSSVTWWNFINLSQKVKLDVKINWLDFESDCVAGGLMGAAPPPPPAGFFFFVYAITQVFHQTWCQKIKLDVKINWFRFWVRLQTNYYIKDLGNNAVCERAEAYQSSRFFSSFILVQFRSWQEQFFKTFFFSLSLCQCSNENKNIFQSAILSWYDL